MVLASAAHITFVPRCWRMYLALWLISRCRLPATPALIFPDAVILKRFLAPDLVFSLGILHRGQGPRPLEGRIKNRPGMPWGQAAQTKARSLGHEGGVGKDWRRQRQPS